MSASLPLNLLSLLLLPLLLGGWIQRVKALWSGRKGPPLLQPAYDVARLLRKSPVYSSTTTLLFRVGPWFLLATTLGSAALVPLCGSRSLASFPFDFVWFAYAWGLGRVALMLAALDTGSSANRIPVQFTPTRTMTNPRALFSPVTETGTPITAETPSLGAKDPSSPGTGPFYEVRTSAGKRLGPWSFAQVVQALSTGQLGPLDRVSIDGSPPRPLGDMPELARHLPSSTVTTNSIATDAGHVKLSGEIMPLDDGGIVHALGIAAISRTTALLLCELGGIRKEIYLKDGVPAFVTSNLAGELLGEYLVAKEVITRGELDMALAVMPRFEGRLGDTLSALGLVEPVVLFRHIGEQVRDKLLDLFLWKTGMCTHYHGVAPPPSGFPLNIDAWDVLDAGLRRRIEHDFEQARVMQLRTKRIVPATGSQLASMRPALPQRLKRLLTALDRPYTAPELMIKLANDEDPEQPLRDSLLLLYLGAVRFVE